MDSFETGDQSAVRLKVMYLEVMALHTQRNS